MFRQAGYELRRHLRSIRFIGSTLLLALLTSLVTWVGMTNHRLLLERQEEQKARHREELEAVTVYSFLRPMLFRPPEALAVFEGGVMSRVDPRIEISVFEIPSQGADPPADNPYLEPATRLDLTIVIAMVFGLEGLLLTFDSISKERERGRLEVLLAHGATLRGLVASKGLAAVGALSISLAAALSPCLLALVRAGHLPYDRQTWGAVLGLTVAYGLYGTVMSVLGLLVSLRSTKSSRALANALLLWLLLVFLWPQAVTAVGEAVSKLQPETHGIEYRIAEKNAILDRRIDDLWSEDPLRTRWSGFRSPYKVDEWDFRILRRFGAREYHESARRHFPKEIRLGRRFALEKYAIRQAEEAVYRRVASWVETVASLSPAYSLERLAAELAGTSPEHHDDFIASAQEYRRRLIEIFERRGIFESPRWYSDDPPEGMAWTTFIGLEPEEVTPQNVAAMRDLFRTEAAQARTATEIMRREHHETIDLEELPEPSWVRAPPFADPRRERWLGAGAWMAIQLLLFSGLLAVSIGRRSGAHRPRRSVAWRLRLPRRLERRALTLAELRMLSREARWLAFLVLILVVTASWVARLEYLAADKHAAWEKVGERLAQGNGERTESIAAFAARRHPLQLPPTPLVVLDNGERKLPRTYWLATNPWQSPSLGGAMRGNPRLSELPALDLAFIAWIVLPLVTFLASYDALCGSSLERLEWLVLSRSPARLLASLLAARWLWLALALVSGLLLGTGSMALLGSWDRPWAELFEVIGFALLVLISTGFFTLLALCASVVLGKASRALVSLVFLWLLLVALIPAAADVLARRLEPLPTPQRIAHELEQIRLKTNAMRSASDWRPIAWARADGFAVEHRSAAIQGLRLERQRRVLSFYFEQQASQALYARQLAELSPMALFADWGQRWLGSGLYRHRAFVRQAESFQAPLEAALREQNARDPSSPQVGLFPNYLSQRPIDSSALPSFGFREPSWREGIRHGWSRGLGLVLCALIAWWLSLAAFERRIRHRGSGQLGEGSTS